MYLLAIPSTSYLTSSSSESVDDSKDKNALSNDNLSSNSASTDDTASNDQDDISKYSYDYIALLDKNMNIVLEASDTYIENSELGVIDSNVPLILGQHAKNSKEKNKTYTYGVYDLTHNDWIIKRIYSYISELGDDYYIAYDNEGVPLLLHKDGSKVIKKDFDSNTNFKLLGNHIVALNDITSSASIYSSSGELIKTLNAKYITLYKNCIITSDTNKDGIVYDENGNSIFSKDSLFKKNTNLGISTNETMTIYQYNEESSLVEVQISHFYIICKLDGTIIKLLNQNEEPNSNLGLVSNGYFTYSSDLTQLSFYNQNGTKYVSSDNNDFTDFIYPNYYYSKENTIELYNYTTNTTYTLDVSKLSSPYLSGIHNNFFFILSHDDPNSVLIYYKDKLVYQGSQSYIELINDNIVVTNVTKDSSKKIIKDKDSTFTPYSALMNSKHIIYDKNGAKIYSSKKSEKILSINESYLQIMRDNAIGICDYDGNFLCKINLSSK
ncbi:hypothetical protein bsdtb5_33340 [Anaeromicropila herbilytica]|uniref:Uncharacterized protein n=1 Tax=Anaeromicropila herbilytica TaxID=2785025 RepID=A0A7R7ENK5_9FIRM|nr:hypothetical protein bsdtb5_33340 [Anaeromicropila herbilytica]